MDAETMTGPESPDEVVQVARARIGTGQSWQAQRKGSRRMRTYTEQEQAEQAAAAKAKSSPLVLAGEALRFVLHLLYALFRLFIAILQFLYGLIQDKILSGLIGTGYIHNVSWDDVDIDQEVLELDNESRVLIPASAGDTMLDMLLSGSTVVAFDENVNQLHLCELKMAIIKALDFETAFAILGDQSMETLRKEFPVLREHMSPQAAAYWSRHNARLTSLMYSGTSGFLAKLLFRKIVPWAGLGWLREQVLQGAEFRVFEQKVKKHEGRLHIISWLADRVLIPFLAPLAGVPQAQLRLGMHRPNNFMATVERLLLQTDIVHDNYFYYGYIVGKYSKQVCPRYLKEEHFSACKQALLENKAELFHGSLLTRLSLEPEPEGFTAMSLRDRWDWMNDEQVNRELAAIWPHLSPDGRFLWRSFSDVPHCACLKWLDATEVDDGSRDRTCMYWGAWMCVKSKSPHVPEAMTTDYTWAETGRRSKLSTISAFWKVFFFGLHRYIAPLKVSRPECSHRVHQLAVHQCSGKDFNPGDVLYDYVFNGRQVLAASLPLPRNKTVWVDVGAGTGRDLEFFSTSVLRQHFSKIYIVDICTESLDIARARVEQAGLSDIVEYLSVNLGSVTEAQRKLLPEPNSVGLVTFSYSLSTIGTAKALEEAQTMLAPTGYLAVVDFFKRGSILDRSQHMFGRIAEDAYNSACVWWLGRVNVHAVDEKELHKLVPHYSNASDVRVRGVVPLAPMLRPWHGVWIRKLASASSLADEGFVIPEETDPVFT
eukprot:m.299622 g.299622  ORF g.299622 m.299622 type:complete len:768 (+) comp15872_c2_seq1:442-2745(+)